MIRILTTLYNSEKYITKTIESLKRQSIKKWKCYITNDLSTDNSEKVAINAIDNDERFQIINNTKKMYQTGNYWQILKLEEIQNQDICITVDGDDWLPDEKVFERVIGYYSDNKTWMTFGQFLYYRGNNIYDKGFSKRPASDNVRNEPWTSSHLRTFKAFLFRNVKTEDLISPFTKEFFNAAGDVVCFTPCMEMAGFERIKYVEDINYVYNVETEINEYKVMLQTQESNDRYIKSKPSYARLEKEI